jgi:hypothetical protein
MSAASRSTVSTWCTGLTFLSRVWSFDSPHLLAGFSIFLICLLVWHQTLQSTFPVRCGLSIFLICLLIWHQPLQSTCQVGVWSFDFPHLLAGLAPTTAEYLPSRVWSFNFPHVLADLAPTTAEYLPSRVWSFDSPHLLAGMAKAPQSIMAERAEMSCVSYT